MDSVSPVRLVTEIGSPHASCVARASSALTPQAGFSPASFHRCLPEEGVSLSPPFKGYLHRIERPGCLRAHDFVGAAFGRASLRRTGRAPLDASGSTGKSTLATAGDESASHASGRLGRPTAGEREPRLDDVRRRDTAVGTDIAVSVSSAAGSAERNLRSSHRFPAATASSGWRQKFAGKRRREAAHRCQLRALFDIE